VGNEKILCGSGIARFVIKQQKMEADDQMPDPGQCPTDDGRLYS
jgi:hypothetical protein